MAAAGGGGGGSDSSGVLVVVLVVVGLLVLMCLLCVCFRRRRQAARKPTSATTAPPPAVRTTFNPTFERTARPDHRDDTNVYEAIGLGDRATPAMYESVDPAVYEEPVSQLAADPATYEVPRPPADRTDYEVFLAGASPAPSARETYEEPSPVTTRPGMRPASDDTDAPPKAPPRKPLPAVSLDESAYVAPSPPGLDKSANMNDMVVASRNSFVLKKPLRRMRTRDLDGNDDSVDEIDL